MTLRSPDNGEKEQYAAWALPEFRYLLAGNALFRLAGRALAVVIGYQVYAVTHDPLSLGFLGLVEAIPAISLALFGGHVADRADRRRIVLLTQCLSIACALSYAGLTWARPHLAAHAWLLCLYGIVFVAGLASGSSNPAASALEAQVIPAEVYLNAASWSGSVGQGCAILGPALGGLAYDFLGPVQTYTIIAALLLLGWCCIFRIAPKPIPEFPPEESIFDSITIGVRYVFRSPILVGSMALDLFAVLFGGAVALLPIFANDILHAGARGFGLLSAAPSVGALIVALWSTRRPPGRWAGPTLLWCVAGFGVSIIVFALSRSVVLSFAMLALSGACDSVSVIIRTSILRLYSPEHLRGRIAAVSFIFIGSSNEIGAFESGFAAKLLGTVRSVWLGGVVTLIVVAATALLAPEIRRLNLEQAER